MSEHDEIDFEETWISDDERVKRFLDALYEAMRVYGVTTTVCYEQPIRDMFMRLLDAEYCKALSVPPK